MSLNFQIYKIKTYLKLIEAEVESRNPHIELIKSFNRSALNELSKLAKQESIQDLPVMDPENARKTAETALKLNS